METAIASSEREDTPVVLAHHVVSEGRPVEEKHRMRAEKTVTACQKTFRDATMGISPLIEDSMTASATSKAANKSNVQTPDYKPCCKPSATRL